MKPPRYLRVALISTSAVAVPPKAYGGTELFVHNLAKTLTWRGHKVTVYATGDSTPEAKLKALFPTAVWPPTEQAEMAHVEYAWEDIARSVPRFDVIHVQQTQSLPFAKSQSVPTILTLHHPRVESLVETYLEYPEIHYVGISKSQLASMPEVRGSVVHHGLDPDMYPVGRGGEYCAFLGRFAPEKGLHWAIEAAQRAGMKLRAGGNAHWVHEDYFQRDVVPLVKQSAEAVELVGEVGHKEKLRLLQNAKALLFPIQWEEPFGLVMIEAMLVGTPVIAFSCGSAPEIVEEGVTGFCVKDVQEMVQRMGELGSIDRRKCRDRAVQHWSSTRMAIEYEQVYRNAIERNRRPMCIDTGSDEKRNTAHAAVARSLAVRGSHIRS